MSNNSISSVQVKHKTMKTIQNIQLMYKKRAEPPDNNTTVNNKIFKNITLSFFFASST